MTRPFLDPLRSGREDGFGLVAALVFILLIAASVAPLAIVSRTRILSSTYAIRKAAFEGMAPEMARVVSLGYGNRSLRSNWQRCERGDRIFYIHYQNQNGLIDLNSAKGDLLQLGFVAMGYDDTDARTLSLRAQRFREPEPTGDAPDAGFEPKRAPFEHVAEILDLLPAELPMRGAADQVFTVYNRTDTVASEHMSPALRQELSKPMNADFLTEGAGASMYAQLSLAEFRNGRSQGLQAKILVERSAEKGDVPKIIEKDIGSSERADLDSQRAQSMPCESFVQRLIGTL